jgi:threonine dehydrogenase-like Zn-dependent dehydrogenase
MNDHEKMRCLWLENHELKVRQVPIPEPRPEEALLRVRLAGICGTDLELVKGYYPYQGIIGHEFVGEVVRAVSDLSLVGKRVVGEINLSCGKCRSCRSGRKTHCETRSVLGIIDQNGSFAEYLCLPLTNLHSVPDSIPDEAAVFCEPLSAACQILQQVSIGRNDHVLLIGAGRLGQLIAQVLSIAGCNISVVARYPAQVKTLNQNGISVIAEADIPKRAVDLVIEATGSKDGFRLARAAVRPRGTIVLKSTYHGLLDVDISAVVVDEITLIGSRCGPFAAALSLLEQGLVKTGPLIEACYPLQDGLQAFEQAARSGAMKVLLRPD